MINTMSLTAAVRPGVGFASGAVPLSSLPPASGAAWAFPRAPGRRQGGSRGTPQRGVVPVSAVHQVDTLLNELFQTAVVLAPSVPQASTIGKVHTFFQIAVLASPAFIGPTIGKYLLALKLSEALQMARDLNVPYKDVFASDMGVDKKNFLLRYRLMDKYNRMLCDEHGIDTEDIPARRCHDINATKRAAKALKPRLLEKGVEGNFSLNGITKGYKPDV